MRLQQVFIIIIIIIAICKTIIIVTVFFDIASCNFGENVDRRRIYKWWLVQYSKKPSKKCDAKNLLPLRADLPCFSFISFATRFRNLIISIFLKFDLYFLCVCQNSGLAPRLMVPVAKSSARVRAPSGFPAKESAAGPFLGVDFLLGGILLALCLWNRNFRNHMTIYSLLL